jgi:4-nitrophenyl phosphatase
VPLREAGMEVALTGDAGEVDGVMLGWTNDFGPADLEAAAQLLWAGKPLYATSIAPHYAGAKGRLLGISGAVAAALCNATGVKATVFGKPETIGLQNISDMLGIPVQEMVVIGDDPKLEIAMARKAGALAVGVTTGNVDAAGFAAADPALRANFVLPGLVDLMAQSWW